MGNQRINISVDVENNKVLDETIEKAIEGAVKAKTREWFEKAVGDETERLCNNAADKLLKKRGSWSDKPSVLEEKIDNAVGAKIDKVLSDADVSVLTVSRMVKEKMDNLDGIIDKVIEHVVTEKLEETGGLDERIRKIVGEKVQLMLPQQVLDLIVKGVAK